MAFSREFILGERGIQESGEFKRDSRGWGEVCPGYLNSAF